MVISDAPCQTDALPADQIRLIQEVSSEIKRINAIVALRAQSIILVATANNELAGEKAAIGLNDTLRIACMDVRNCHT